MQDEEVVGGGFCVLLLAAAMAAFHFIAIPFKRQDRTTLLVCLKALYTSSLRLCTVVA
jgi:hypothetical protein